MSIARYLARQLIPPLLARGWSGRRIERQLKRAGLSYRRKVFLTDVRKYRLLRQSKDLLARYPTARLLPREAFFERELEFPARYRIYGVARYQDKATGRLAYQNVSFYSDARDSKEGWAGGFIDRQRAEMSTPDRINTGTEIVQVIHNRGYSW